MYRQIKLHPEDQNYQLILWYEHSLLLNSPLYSLYYKHKKQLFGQYNLHLKTIFFRQFLGRFSNPVILFKYPQEMYSRDHLKSLGLKHYWTILYF